MVRDELTASGLITDALLVGALGFFAIHFVAEIICCCRPCKSCKITGFVRRTFERLSGTYGISYNVKQYKASKPLGPPIERPVPINQAVTHPRQGSRLSRIGIIPWAPNTGHQAGTFSATFYRRN